MRLFTGVLFIICIILSACIYTVYLVNTEFLGYAGYCSYETIPSGLITYVFETWILALYLIFLISYRNFHAFCSITFSCILLGILTLNLSFLAYKIYEFPRVLEKGYWGFYPNFQVLNDQVLGLDYNPLIPIFILFALNMLWLNHVSKTGTSKMFYRTIKFMIIGLSITVGSVVALSISYDMCMG